MTLSGRRRPVGDLPYPLERANRPRTEFAPDWSPDGRWLAVTLGNWIWKVPASGKGAKRLAKGDDPAWSPDGKHIAFVSTRDGDAEIFVVGTDGSGVRRVTNNSWYDAQPDW